MRRQGSPTRAAAAAFLCALAAALSPGGAPAQRLILHEPASAAEALELFRRTQDASQGLVASSLRRMLSQENRSYPRATLDSLADGLVEIVLTARAGSHESVYAMSVLTMAGLPQARVPYPRSFELLVRIFENAADAGIRGATLWDLYEVDQERAVRFWADVAQGKTPGLPGIQEIAVDLLANRGGERGREILRELHARDLVREPRARAYLQWLASRNFIPLSPAQPKDTGAARAPERRPLPSRKD